MNNELRLFEDDEYIETSVEAPTVEPVPEAVVGPAFVVEIERSTRRKRTVGAQLVGGVLKIVIPSWMSRVEQQHWVDVMTRRFERKMSTDRVDLVERALTLARRHDLPRAREISWSDNMLSRWGSCTPTTGCIRISTRLAPFPDWVLDYVIVHELAHLEVGDHSAEFWRLAHRYPKAERAIGYLIAKSGDEHD
ncbi:MAG: M48 family metallopeptidase [Actinobacteria bacterium]|nr:M48 family metallopeptidase [Actinomycetota bacterium]